MTTRAGEAERGEAGRSGRGLVSVKRASSANRHRAGCRLAIYWQSPGIESRHPHPPRRPLVPLFLERSKHWLLLQLAFPHRVIGACLGSCWSVVTHRDSRRRRAEDDTVAASFSSDVRAAPASCHETVAASFSSDVRAAPASRQRVSNKSTCDCKSFSGRFISIWAGKKENLLK